MKKDHKEMVTNLTNRLINITDKFITERLEFIESINTGLLIDITLSAHFSSCFTMMKHLAENLDKSKEMTKEVNKFIRKMEDILPTINPIKKVEIIRSNK